MDECAVRVSVVLASDIRPCRDRLVQMLAEAPGMVVVASVADAPTLLREVRDLRPAVTLIDMMMKDAFEAAREVAGAHADTRIVALCMNEDDRQMIVGCARIGVAGYVLQEDPAGEALEAIHAAARGEVHCSPRVVSFLLRHIAQLLHDGLSNRMISRDLGIGLQTVKNHVHNILAKLAVHRRAEAVSLMRRRGGLLESAAELRPAGRR
jgi:DNA-binding NarL/FixJ family response regulator